jgi:hypothetical protein
MVTGAGIEQPPTGTLKMVGKVMLMGMLETDTEYSLRVL